MTDKYGKGTMKLTLSPILKSRFLIVDVIFSSLKKKKIN